MNSPPAIISIHSDLQELPEYSDLGFTMGPGTLTLTLLDTDVGDKLEVRIFVDYTPTRATAPRSTCLAPSQSSATRTASCPLNALCLPEDVGQTRQMQVLVFDRTVMDGVKPLFQAMMDPTGLTTSRTFKLECQSP